METSVAVYPTIWRVRLLLTSRVWDPEQDVCIWETGSGQMAAFAMLWRRRATSPYLALDRFIHPSFAYSELASDMLAWGSQRAEAIVAGQAIPLTVYAQDFPPSSTWITVMKAVALPRWNSIPTSTMCISAAP